MKKQNFFWIGLLSLFAIYFFLSAFIPSFHLIFSFSLWLSIFFFWLALTSRSIWMTGLALATLSFYLQRAFHLPYAKWPLFWAILLLGIVLSLLGKPKRRGAFIINLGDRSRQSRYIENEREAYARSFFSENNIYVSSENLDQVNVDVQFGELNLDLQQAQFMTDQPSIDLSVTFGEATISLPSNWRLDTNSLHLAFGEINTLGRPEASQDPLVTVKVSGKCTFGEITFRYS